jgi:hypothetical protein
MRPDMAKIIVERPRPGIREPRGHDGRRFRNVSDSRFLPMKAGYREHKEFNENLRPLARYLARQVGRPWDAVYRDVRAVIDGRSTVQQHILQHLTQFVATHTRVVEGLLIDLSAERFSTERVWQLLYVHPRTGLLRRNSDKLVSLVQSRDRARAAERARCSVAQGLADNAVASPERGLVRSDDSPAASNARDAVGRRPPLWVESARARRTS